jgi:succinoglycan biosynthesis protein ExoA
MTLSIICPTLNEIKYIEQLINSFTVNDGIEKEIFFVDGGSTDGTIEKINQLKSSKGLSNIHVVSNPNKFVSHGFNKAFPFTKGKYITLLGAHTNYPKSFFKIGISYLEKNETDVVGGPLLQIGKSYTGKIIAKCMSSKFGVGNTEFRTSNEKRFVDSVAFAIYKREIFNKIGLLDEDLIRNQDDELHYRINSKGYKILMVPEMQCEYFVRDSVVKLFKQYFDYGYYKPLVLKKVNSGFRLRHIIPLLFTLYLLLFPLFYSISFVFLLPLLFYIVTNLLISILITKNLFNTIIAFYVFFNLHLSYGLGFLLGLRKIF